MWASVLLELYCGMGERKGGVSAVQAGVESDPATAYLQPVIDGHTFYRLCIDKNIVYSNARYRAGEFYTRAIIALVE